MSISREKTINVAEVLTEAMPYIRKFHGAVLVIKVGGSTMTDEALLNTLARDMVLLKLVGMNPIVVHGGGPQIDELLTRLEIEPQFIDGMRVTDAQTMELVQMVLVGQINQNIVTHINENGGNAMGITGKDGALIEARKLRATGKNSDKVDYGQVGEVVRINRKVLDVVMRSDFVPVIAPIGYGDKGVSYNINADLAASAIAAELKAEKLILLTNTAGVLDNQGNTLSALSSSQVAELIAQGSIHGGMLPKVSCALQAVENGTQKAHIIDGMTPHALLVEMLTDQGVGTLISQP